jgi:uncharacterized protein (TIGR00297 family)
LISSTVISGTLAFYACPGDFTGARVSRDWQRTYYLLFMVLQYCLVLFILGSGMFFSVKAGKLTDAGAITGGLIGFAVFLGAGFTGLAMLATFFIAGSAASAWKINYKISLGLAEENKGRRTAGQAFANGGVAGILGLLSWRFPAHSGLFNVMLAASLASATSDTLSSELGNIYGTRYYNILTLRSDKRGLNGVVSIEGTVLGTVGSCLIGLLYGPGFDWNGNMVCIVLAGTIGNISDSVLGATLERKFYLNNNAVNFLNTLIAALAALVIYLLADHYFT